MHAYLVIPLVACVSSGMVVMAILNRDVQHRANRLAALLVFGVCVWSFFEVLWNTADRSDVALWLVRGSTLGWIWLGPLGLHLFLALSGGPERRARRLLPALYGVSALFLAIALATPWMHPSVERMSWGWAYTLGPAYWGFYPFTVACLLSGFFCWLRSALRSPSPGERSQIPWLVTGILVPFVVASLTDGLLPVFGHQVPRLGTISFAALGAVMAWGFFRHGYSLLAPGLFAREIVETLPDGVLLLSLDACVRTVNGGMARLAGCAGSELEGKPVATLLPALAGEPDAELKELECELHPALGEVIPVSVSASLLCDKQGLPLGRVVVVRDLREVVTLRNRLVLSGRLAAVGELAAGIAHEINNPIAFVRSNLSVLQSFLKDLRAKEGTKGETQPEIDWVEADSLVEESLEGVDRVGAIVRDVKGFSHAGRSQRELVDLNPLLNAALRVASPQLRYTGRVERCFADLAPVLAAPQELKQVFLNLIVNAAQAIDEGGTIRLVTERQGNYCVARVEDNGRGIPPEALERVFDPFFTTKAVGDGSGLGLAISYQIVRNHGGDIHIASEPGRGTSVRVRLPVAPDATGA